MFVELDTRHDARYTVSLEWDRNTGETQIVVGDSGTSSLEHPGRRCRPLLSYETISLLRAARPAARCFLGRISAAVPAHRIVPMALSQ